MLLLTLAVIEETGKICRHCGETTQNIHHKLYALLGKAVMLERPWLDGSDSFSTSLPPQLP